MEVHPILILGLCASLIIFLNSNQSPRNTYQCAMQKQCHSAVPWNSKFKTDTNSYSLCYPETPLVQSMIEKTLGLNNCPMGQNASVLICIFSGYNQEDAIIVNKSSIDRGFLMSMATKLFKDSLKIKNTDPTSFAKPDPKTCRGMKNANYEKLDENGFIRVGEKIDPGDVVIAKIMAIDDTTKNGNKKSRQKQSTIYRDNSMIYSSNESCRVEKVIRMKNKKGADTVKVFCTSKRHPEKGDKLSTRQSQKGVIGEFLSQEDLPFNSLGQVPDIIINPHSMPSRMTSGMINEAFLGKAAAYQGKVGDGTPFIDKNGMDEEIGRILQENGCTPHGKEIFYNPHTGLPMEAMIFHAPLYYQRLRHMVIDKIQARSTGPVQLLTQQPLEGRAKFGGLRFGEMERDVVISYGGPHFLKDSLFDRSDAYETDCCATCGLIAEPARKSRKMNDAITIRGNEPYCRNCRSTENIKTIKIPYPLKLLVQELMSMNIAFRFRFDDDEQVSVEEIKKFE